MSEKLFVLDTNVLMHDPTALFRFEEHDIFLPMVVLEELDKHKRGAGDINRNVRQVSRFLDHIVRGKDRAAIQGGLELGPAAINGNGRIANPTGRLYFEVEVLDSNTPSVAQKPSADTIILDTARALQRTQPDRQVIIITKDINLRIKAAVLGVATEDYSNDSVTDDTALFHTGFAVLPQGLWENHGGSLESWKREGRTFYRFICPDVEQWYPNQCLYFDGGDGFEGIVREKRLATDAVIEQTTNYRQSRRSVWGITARNREQNFALNMLMDPEIHFVTLVGNAGTGKTLLALAAGLAQVLDRSLYREIVMTRVTVPVGEDIGFLPGTEEEKMTPWMGALMDNLEVLTPDNGNGWNRSSGNDLLRRRIRIASLNFMRGRTFLNRYLILDEAQNLTAKQMKTLISRAGPGTKVVCLGNIAQIDTPYLSEATSGLTYVVNRCKGWYRSGHIILQQGERSELADFANTHL